MHGVIETAVICDSVWADHRQGQEAEVPRIGMRVSVLQRHRLQLLQRPFRSH